jgi:hypothetical protein
LVLSIKDVSIGGDLPNIVVGLFTLETTKSTDTIDLLQGKNSCSVL